MTDLETILKNRGLILAPEVEAYLMATCPESPQVIAEMEAYAVETGFPIVGPQVGRFLWQMACLKGAHQVFEMGSGFGYSTAWLALAVGEHGRVQYTDSSPENCERARGYLGRLGLNDRVVYHVGEAIEILERVQGAYDVVLVDVDKRQYPRAFEVAVPRVVAGGLLIFDNALWRGKVAREEETDSATRSVREYHRMMFEHPDLISTLLPLRDGIGLSYKMR